MEASVRESPGCSLNILQASSNILEFTLMIFIRLCVLSRFRFPGLC